MSLSSAIEAFRGKYPHTAPAVLHLLERVNTTELYGCRRSPQLAQDVAAALPWLDAPRIELVDLRSMQQRFAKSLFDSFRESSLGREIWPQDAEAYGTAIHELQPFVARLDSPSFQTALHKLFGELTETYALTFFGFVTFKACCMLLAVEERAFTAGFARLLTCFEQGIHVPGLDRNGTVLVLVK